MKKSILLFLSIVASFSCSNQPEQKQNAGQAEEVRPASDILIGKKIIGDEIAGSSYRKRATGYFVIMKNDTSGFMPVFAESKDDNKVDILLNLSYSNKAVPYVQRLDELKLILPNASSEFNLDSLAGMSVGRLILTGDLAIGITLEYIRKFGVNEKITTADYRNISNFLLETKLAKDLNELFEPYSIKVDKIVIEKAFFTTKDELMNYSRLVTDTAEIPDRILDCMTWIKFKKIEQP